MKLLHVMIFMLAVDIPFSLVVKQILEGFGLSSSAVWVVRFLLVLMVNCQISFKWRY